MHSKKVIWTGRTISLLCALFMFVDGGMKAVEATPSIDASALLGWPDTLVQTAGIILITCTILYVIPCTAILGAILITAYLGGATAIMLRVGQLTYFPVIFGVFVWTGLFLRNKKLRSLMPFTTIP